MLDEKSQERLEELRAKRDAKSQKRGPKKWPLHMEYTAGELKKSRNPEIVFGADNLPDGVKMWAQPEQVGFEPGGSDE